jgi:hypothetical protein
MSQRFLLIALLAMGLVDLAAAGAAPTRSKGLEGRFVGSARLGPDRKRVELELVRTGFGLYQGGCTFKLSLDDPGVSCSAEGRDLGRNRVQILLECEDGSRQEWRGTLKKGGKQLSGKIEGTKPVLTGGFKLHRSSR